MTRGRFLVLVFASVTNICSIGLVNTASWQPYTLCLSLDFEVSMLTQCNQCWTIMKIALICAVTMHLLHVHVYNKVSTLHSECNVLTLKILGCCVNVALPCFLRVLPCSTRCPVFSQHRRLHQSQDKYLNYFNGKETYSQTGRWDV